MKEQKSYPSEISDHAKSFGYKAANLMFLGGLIEEFKQNNHGINSTIPAFVAITNESITQYMRNNIDNFDQRWNNFCAVQKDEKVINRDANLVLLELRQNIKKLFKEKPFIINDLPDATNFMVRSTGEEDRVDVANPGGNESVSSLTKDISENIGKVIASYISEKSLNQRSKLGEDIKKFPLSPCLIQEMAGDKSLYGAVISGVIYTDNGHVRIQSAPGHGELIVNSKGNFDNYYITPNGKVYAEIRNKYIRISSEINKQTGKLEQIERDNNFKLATNPSLDEKTAIYLHNLAVFIEQRYGMRMDIEFSYDIKDKTVNILQARPIPDGSGKGKRPSALSNEFISLNQPQNLKAIIITPDINYASTITNSGEILVCDNIEQALDVYLKNDNQIKTVIIKKAAPDTSHEAGMFTAKGISVLQMENIDEVRIWAENLNDNILVCDPQHKKLYLISKTNYSDELIKDGIFASTLSPHVTPFNREFKANDPIMNELFESMKNSNTIRYDAKLLGAHLDDLSKLKFGEQTESQKKILASLLQFSARQKKKENISADLFKEIMLTGGELNKLLSSMKEETYNEKKSQFYLNVFEKFNGLMLGKKKKDVLSSSILQEMNQTKQTRKYLEKAPKEDYLGIMHALKIFTEFSETNKQIFNSLKDEQKDEFLELVKLDKFIMKDKNKFKWKRFCLEAYQNNQENILINLVKEITKYDIHDYFLNTVFCSEYDKNPENALASLDQILDKGRGDREDLSTSAKILTRMESQVSQWARPEKFDELYIDLQQDLQSLEGLLKYDSFTHLKESIRDQINGPIRLHSLNKLVDIFDLSIKKVQVSDLYDPDKIDQVNNFCRLVMGLDSLMDQLHHKNDINSNYDNLVQKYYQGKIKNPDKSNLTISVDLSLSKQPITLENLRSSQHKNQNLSFIHTFIHQLALKYIGDLNQYIPININLAHDRIAEINKLFANHFANKKTFLNFKVFNLLNDQDYIGRDLVHQIGREIRWPNPQLLEKKIEYPKFYKLKYNIPLDRHSGALEAIFDMDSDKVALEYKLFMNNVGGRDKIITTYGELLIKNTLKKSEIVVNYYKTTETLIIKVKTSNDNDVRSSLEIFNSLSLSSYSFGEELCKAFEFGVYKRFLSFDQFEILEINSEVKNLLKQYHAKSEVISTKGIEDIKFPRLEMINALKRLSICNKEVTDFLNHSETINLIKHGLDINSLIDRAENEDLNGFSIKDKEYLNSLELGAYVQNDEKSKILDSLKIRASDPNLDQEKLSIMRAKLIERLTEKIILANDLKGFEEILRPQLTLLNDLVGNYQKQKNVADSYFKKAQDYIKKLFLHGHAGMYVSIFGNDQAQIQRILESAVDNRESTIVKTIIDIDMKIVNNEKNNTILYNASCQNSDIEIVKILLKSGIKANHERKSLCIEVLIGETKDPKIRKLLKKYAYNPVDYLLESHQNNPNAFINSIENLKISGYDFKSNDLPLGNPLDSDEDKITEFLNHEIVVGKHKISNFRKIIKSGDVVTFEAALSFAPDIHNSDLDMIKKFYPQFQFKPEHLKNIVNEIAYSITKENVVTPIIRSKSSSRIGNQSI